MTGPDCEVMCNLINTHTHTHTSPLGGSMRVACDRMTRITGPDCAVMCNLILRKYTHTHKNVEKKGFV